ncbi:MAG: bifunctional diaminohydroxyphosphoribosylaminopyrimidine deaminase/5-amino-6-(5-phosphoribosylamino)uracil reductase RibD [Candidatus Brocadiia bacterium]
MNAIKYMSLSVKLAKSGQGRVEPNPLVGAVIVKSGRIIGTGYHQYFGGPHAEINAINSVKKPKLLKGATLYINLEPCVHFGKTPPCAPAIIQSGIKKVVIAHPDPNPLVSGKGIRMLKNAGIKVAIIESQEAMIMNAPFFKYHKTGLPYVIAKWAMTADGKLASVTGDSKWISSEQSRALVQQIRSKVQGILAGINTVLKDDPMLTPNLKSKTHLSIIPARIIVDTRARIPLDSWIVKTASTIKTYIAVAASAPAGKLQALAKRGCIIIRTTGRNTVDIKDLLKQLGRIGIIKILVEGGGQIHSSALMAGLVDEAYIFIAPKIIGGRDAKTPVEGPGIKLMRQAINLKNISVKSIGPDVLIHGLIK